MYQTIVDGQKVEITDLLIDKEVFTKQEFNALYNLGLDHSKNGKFIEEFNGASTAKNYPLMFRETRIQDDERNIVFDHPYLEGYEAWIG